MQFKLSQTFNMNDVDCLVIGTFQTALPAAIAAQCSVEQTNLLAQLSCKLQKMGQYIWQGAFGDTQLLLISCAEKAEDFTVSALLKTLNIIADQLLKNTGTTARIALPQCIDLTEDEQLEKMILKLDDKCYQLLDFKQDKSKANALTTLDFFHPEASQDALQKAIHISQGIQLTKTLANLPANICTPRFLAQTALDMTKEHANLTTTILDENDLATLKMNAFLAVSKGSHEPPRLIEMHYQGAPKSQPIILVGKGITFDSGGITLKPGNGMEEMKYDMAGAASVMGVMKICAALKLPLHVIGLMACAENMPGGGATHPGDIVTTFSGQTVEIVNTDAEGRLVLADTLTYIEQFNPRFVIDMATLTGAIIIALGHEYTGFMTSNDALADSLLKASQKSQDKIWRMPMDEAYQEALESPLADMVNATFDRAAGSVTAAAFLSRYTQKYVWAHLDIAGTAWQSGRKNHATGRPVPLIVELLRHVAHAS